MIGAFTTTFDELPWVRAIAPQLAVFPHVVVVGARHPLYWQHPAGSPPPPPDLAALCEEYGFEFIQYEGQERGGAQLGRQRQRAMDRLRELGCSAAAWFAPDELFTVNGAIKLRDALEADPHRVAIAPFHTLWWNERWEVSYWPPLNGLPIDYRCDWQDAGLHSQHPQVYREGPFNLVDATCWHFAFARPDEEMKQKFYTWGHADARVFSEGHWKSWAEGASMYWPSANEAPVPVKEPFPDELRERLKDILPRLRVR